MASLQIVSDIHINYDGKTNIPDISDYIIPTAPILILAGDIGSFYNLPQLVGFLEKTCEEFDYVIFVPGNHEYYMRPEYSERHTPEFLLARFRDATGHLPKLHILTRNSIRFGNELCIAGCTLWSKPTIPVNKYRVKIYGINTDLFSDMHATDLKYIKGMVRYCKTKNLKLVVVTHYCPTYDVLFGSGRYDKYRSLYVSNLDVMLNRDDIHTWICGHTHKNFDMLSSGGTRVVSNQHGTPRDHDAKYQKNFSINL